MDEWGESCLVRRWLTPQMQMISTDAGTLGAGPLHIIRGQLACQSLQ